MTGAVTVTPASAAEAAELVPCYAWLFAPPGGPPPHWDEQVAAQRLAAVSASDAAEVLVATAGGADGVVGFCTVYLDLLSVRYGPRSWVEDLAVRPDHRSSGVGGRLLDAAVAWATARGATHLELDTGVDRVDAQRFYERRAPSWRSLCYGWELP